MEKDIAFQIKKTEKIIRNTRLSSILFLVVLVAGAALEIPLNILAPVIVGAALLMVAVIGIPAQRKLIKLKKKLSEEIN